MKSHIKRLRLAGAEALGRKLTQQDAGELIGAGTRNWYNWESGLREMSPTAAELFCLKTGLEFSPDLLTGKITPQRAKPKLMLVPKPAETNIGFLTVTDTETHLTLTINVSLIKFYKFNRKTKGTSIHLVTGDVFEAEETTGEFDEALGTASIVPPIFS